MIKNKHEIVAMVGSSRFRSSYEKEAKRLTLLGYLVIPLSLYRDKDYEDACVPENAETLKSICNYKIRICDLVFVVNKDGYIGNRTRETIEYAKSLNKKIIYME